MFETPAKACSGFIDSAKNIAEIIAIIIGGFWTYYQFFRGRTFRPRLEFAVSGAINHSGDSDKLELLASVQLKNVGLSRVKINQKGSALIISRSLPAKEEPPAPVGWEQLLVLPVFEKHEWIEPNEPVRDEILVKLSTDQSTALKIDVRLIANKIEWNQVSIIPVYPDRFQSETAGGKPMSRLREQKSEDRDVTKKIEDAKFTRQKKEDQKETERIEHDKVKNKKESK